MRDEKIGQIVHIGIYQGFHSLFQGVQYLLRGICVVLLLKKKKILWSFPPSSLRIESLLVGQRKLARGDKSSDFDFALMAPVSYWVGKGRILTLTGELSSSALGITEN
jgi:hypothetical protein